MSIREIIQANLGHRLFVLEPAIKSDRSERTMIVSQEVLDAVDTEMPDNWDGLRLADFRNTLDHFTLGEEMTVAEDPFQKPSDCFLARVADAKHEVIAIRTLFGPGIRAFGFVADHNCLLALTWNYREDLDFEEERRRCSHEWNQLFGNLEPYSKGKRLDACFTKVLAV